MCLLSEIKDPKIANRDIPIFKLLSINKDKLISPWKFMEYELNKLYINEKLFEPLYVFSYYFIEDGYYHAYISLKSIISEFTKYPSLKKNYSNGVLKIFKGVIPKGSKCYIGIKGDIASNQIKLTEECTL